MPFLRPPSGGISEAVIRAAWLDGCRTGAVVVALVLILVYLWGKK